MEPKGEAVALTAMVLAIVVGGDLVWPSAVDEAVDEAAAGIWKAVAAVEIS